MTAAKTSIRTTLLAAGASAALLLAGCSSDSVEAQPGEISSAAAETQQRIDTVVADVMAGAGATEAVVGVWLPDGKAYVRGYGDGVSANTLVQAGQQTAPASCALLLELANDKLFALDDKIAASSSRLTALLDETRYRQLCDGNTRFADYKNYLQPQVLNNPGRIWNENELLAEAAAHSPLPHSGLDYHLVDTNTVLALKLARALTSHSSTELLQTRVFGPGGMTNTSYPDLHNNTVPAGSLTPLQRPGNPGSPSCDVEATQLSAAAPSFLAGAGAATTTVTDLKQLYTLLFDGHYGNQRLVEELLTPHSLANPQRDERGNETAPGAVAEPGAVPYSETVLATEKIGPLYGRSSWLPGTVGATFHDPESNFTVSIQLNNSSVVDGYAREAALLLAAELTDAGVVVPWTSDVSWERLNGLKVCQ